MKYIIIIILSFLFISDPPDSSKVEQNKRGIVQVTDSTYLRHEVLSRLDSMIIKLKKLNQKLDDHEK